jgi:hypothetical protein
MRWTRSTCLLLAAAVCGTDCSPPKPPETSVVDARPQADRKKKAQTWGELGVLDVRKVDDIFGGLKDSLSACFNRGNKFSAGTILYAMRVDHQGRVKYAFAKETELADRSVERCMLDLLRKATWPIPDGGDDGLVEKPITFPEREERPAEEWSQDRVLPALVKIKAKLQGCRAGNSGIFRATMIIEKSGKVASAGVAPPDDLGEAAVDCMVEALKTVKLPSPGSWPAKVGFEIP